MDDVAERLIDLGRDEGTRGLATSGTTVGRWERRECKPRPPYPRLLCLLFGASAVELGLAASPYAPASDKLEQVERRRVLRLVTGALAVPIAVRSQVAADGATPEAEADRLAHALSRPSKADEAAASVVEASIAAARRLDDVSGPRIAAGPALAQREVIRTMLQGGPSEVVTTRLIVAAGELSQLLAWLAFDMNDYSTSLGYLDEALRIAHETEDHNLGAYVLGYRSVVEVAEGRAQQGLGSAEAARSWAEAKGSPAVRSWLAIAEAEARASLQDRTGGERALDRARKAFARSKPENEPSWLYYYDEPCLLGRIGSVYLTLGLAEPARRSLKEALATEDASMVRDRAWRLARFGQTYVLDGEVEEACRLAGEALTIAVATRSDEVILRVRELRAQLKPWETEAVVRTLDDQLATTAAWCKPPTA